MRYLPNVLSILRMLLVVPTSLFLWHGEIALALGLMAVAGISDGVDGALARHYNWQTHLGSILDPLADKILVAATFIVFTFQGYIPLWLAVLTIGRDLIILFGGTLYRIFFGPFEIKPSLISKANTAMQVVTLILIMLYLLPSASVQLPLLAQLGEYLGGSTEQWVDPYCLWLLAMLGAVSGAHYVVVWGARARRELTRRKQAEVIAREGSSDS
ncbi:MAG: CDP-alcohol phosphatidyltransferase [Gammaproteobacteria bacterium]|nr:CDP-alcohol phosphatidyltransferase [Gammaproteobacteria bacterium]|tara:strand:+ start:1686 stop:2327 length:642 start_codon:yes stop_codon:yes gene_type:complete